MIYDDFDFDFIFIAKMQVRARKAFISTQRKQSAGGNARDTPVILRADSSSPSKSMKNRINLLTRRASSSQFNSLISTCWALYDSNSDIQLGFRPNYQREIASLTKIMTTILALELQERFNISSNVFIKVTDSASKKIGTTANLKANRWVFLQDLYYAIMLPSGNDASQLVAQFMGYVLVNVKQDPSFSAQKLKIVDLGDENLQTYLTEFVRVMNVRADELELRSTRFSNAHGLQNALNISTARDIMKLSQHAAAHKTFRKVMNAEHYRLRQFLGDDTYKKQTTILQNTNILLKQGWQGVKTGQTSTAGNCLSSLKKGIFIVVLNCPSHIQRFTQTKRLYEWYMQSGKDYHKMMLSTASTLYLQN